MGKQIYFPKPHGVQVDTAVCTVVDWRTEFAGQVIAFDISILLHQTKNDVAIAARLLEENYKLLNTRLSLLIAKLRTHNIVPIFVFDGLDQPAKAAEQEKRRALQSAATDKLTPTGSRAEDISAAVAINEKLVGNVQSLFIRLGVSYEVAPYQADAQLVQAEREHRAHAVWSTDGDIMVHGCKRQIKEWNWSNGHAVLITADALFSSSHNRMLRILKKYGHPALLLSAVVKCDYYNLAGMGPVMWMNVVEKIDSVDVEVFANFLQKNIDDVTCKILRGLNAEQVKSDTFLAELKETISNFEDALVYDCAKKQIVSLSGRTTEQLEQLPYLGSIARLSDAAGSEDMLVKHVSGNLRVSGHVYCTLPIHLAN
jgi:5'-3' exonuclease